MFAYTRHHSTKLCLGAVSDSSHYQQWRYLQLLYPRMSIFREWQNPTPPPDQLGEVFAQPSPDRGFICDLAFSRDGRLLLAASSNGDVYLFNSSNQRLRAALTDSHYPSLKVSFVGDRNFVTASTDNNIVLWDVRNTRKAINTLRGHTNLIRSLDYDKESDKLLSSSYDGNVRYWHMQSYQTEREDIDSEDTANYRGVLLTCKDLNQVTVNRSWTKLLMITSKGVIYAISNFDIEHVKEDSKLYRFDDTLPLLLSWMRPNSSTNKQNSVKMISSSDYSVDQQFKLSKIHCLTTHPDLPLAMIRFNANRKMFHCSQSKSWTSVYRLDDTLSVEDTMKFSTVKAYGADIVEENLLFTCEETRYRTVFEKKSCFSKCGRVIASPEKNGVRLLSFSDKLDSPLSVRNAPSASSLSSSSMLEVWASHEPMPLVTVATIGRDVDSVMCTRFGEAAGGLMLAVGEMEGKVSFHQPKL